jgi:hypothetical protein
MIYGHMLITSTYITIFIAYLDMDRQRVSSHPIVFIYHSACSCMFVNWKLFQMLLRVP